jgi:hypothetical protein
MGGWVGNSLNIFKQLLDNFGRMCARMPDNRRPGHNEHYRIADLVKSACGVFFFQLRSMPDYQRKMKEKQGRNNPETAFGGTVMPVMAEMIARRTGKRSGIARLRRGNVVTAEWGSIPAAETDAFGGRFVFPRALLPAGSGSGV